MQYKIVIVDDDESLQDVAKLIFERAGYNTVVLGNARPLYEGEHADADVILMDRQLSGADGVVVCRDLKRHALFANTPILLMSATGNINECLKQSGADGFIEKPFRKSELLKRIEETLSTTRAPNPF